MGSNERERSTGESPSSQSNYKVDEEGATPTTRMTATVALATTGIIGVVMKRATRDKSTPEAGRRQCHWVSRRKRPGECN